MSVFSMLEEVKEALRPDPSVRDVRDEALTIINAELEKRQVMARAVPGGSVAKDTFLRDDHDIDVFVRFALDYDMEDEELPDILEDVLSRFKPERIHGSRDYFQFSYRDFDFEVIPVLAVEDATRARNVTDMSPLHVTYFRAHGEGLQDEVRLAKQFCKAAGVYGAESYIRGFSGHVIDLLVVRYKSFYELAKAAASWKAPVVIDLEGHHKDPLTAIDPQKHAPLLIVDPVQPERNAAAALSQEQFDRFVARCKSFMRSPSESFFIIESFDEKRVRERLAKASGAAVLVTLRSPDDDKPDIAGARVRKAFERIESSLERAGFTVVERGWHFAHKEDSYAWYVTKEHSLPRLVERQGPPVSAKADAERFKKTHEETYERDGRLHTKAERALRRPEQVPAALRHHLKEQLHISVENVKRIEEADE